jgi:hypothetical protein
MVLLGLKDHRERKVRKDREELMAVRVRKDLSACLDK